MNDFTAQPQSQTDGSYVDQYQPPTVSSPSVQDSSSPFAAPAPAPTVPSSTSSDFPSIESTDPSNSTPAPTEPLPIEMAPPEPPVNFDPNNQPAITAPPVDEVAMSDENPSGPSEALEDQNIFEMLGVANGTEAQKEAFLDELQQVIWEDFLEHDVQLLITTEDYQQLQSLLGERPTVDLEQQEKIVVFLEKLIPDLEEIMLEKALELKSDMFRERIAGMREYYTNDTDEHRAAQEKITAAEQRMNRDHWRTAALMLNEI
jgi:hypothetical protein